MPKYLPKASHCPTKELRTRKKKKKRINVRFFRFSPAGVYLSLSALLPFDARHNDGVLSKPGDKMVVQVEIHGFINIRHWHHSRSGESKPSSDIKSFLETLES